MAASTNAAEAPAQEVSAPPNAGPAAKAALRASSSRPLAFARFSRSTSAGTRAGAATLKPTVPTAPMKPSTASNSIERWFRRIAASTPSKASMRSASAATIRRRREVRSASKPNGIDSNRNGNDCTAASMPISPGPAPSISTAMIGAAARLNCSADCAARLDHVSATRERGRTGESFEVMKFLQFSGRTECSAGAGGKHSVSWRAIRLFVCAPDEHA